MGSHYKRGAVFAASPEQGKENERNRGGVLNKSTARE